ncbi:carbonate dehydratase [Methylohalobius crimeensis]|uniref:carbonate dehydratase n=1 Tax=Methylohalobius crimeensis TaxID=244365 RepID=UPI0004147EB9|nr:carbonate dehydratase [Methylohalobius crimeensis]
MRLLQHLFDNNRRWVKTIEKENPGFFQRLSRGQSPEYLWIGCSDSRIPANEVVGLLPGELFVHRNVANLVIHSDMNLLSVLQYAVEVLKVKHVIVCGHYGCGGVLAAMQCGSHGLIDNWLRFIKDTYHHNLQLLEDEPEERRADRLCELNVIQQVANVCHTSIVQNAWRRNQTLAVHGWIYDIKDGLLKDLDVCISAPEQIPNIYQLEARID